MARRTGTLIVGIAGGSGTGKTTVSEHLVTSSGAVHVDGDGIAHEVLRAPAVIRSISDEFAGVVIEGVVDRRALGRLVFADQSRLDTLNAIVHPWIAARVASDVAAARDSGARLVVVDAALLLEVALPFGFDLLLALRCDTEERVRRLLSKGHRSEAEIRDRIARQSAMEKHFYKADAVVDTGRDLSAVLADVDRLVQAARSRIEKEN